MSAPTPATPWQRPRALHDAVLPGHERYLIVSLHDVHPGSWRRYRSFLDELAAAGVGRTSLLAIPNWQGRAPIDESPELAAWLRAAAARDHDICLHGFLHGVMRVRGGVVAQLIGRLYTDREGEFYHLGYREAVRRLRAGRDMLDRVGLEGVGFTPPAWLAGREVLRALADLGFVYTTTLGTVVLPGESLRLRAPTLVFSSRSRWRRRASLSWVPRWARLAARARVLRIAVHPGDLLVPQIHACLCGLIRDAAAGRHAITYRDLAAAAARSAPDYRRAAQPAGYEPVVHDTNHGRYAHRLSNRSAV